MNKLDITRLLREKQIIKIGKLNKNVINILELQCKDKNIKIGYDRISHCNKHKPDFENEQSYNKSMELLPDIINNPDYVGYNSNNNSIEYIKRIDDVTLVAVRFKERGDLFLRSVYPITESKLQNGIELNKYKKYK